MEKLPTVKLMEGTGKYVQMSVKSVDTKEEKILVWMDTAAGYHENVYQPCFELADDLGLDCDCLGGGRIKMDTAAKTIFVYGYSVQFGRANHTISVALIKQQKDYTEFEVTYSDEGYAKAHWEHCEMHHDNRSTAGHTFQVVWSGRSKEGSNTLLSIEKQICPHKP